MDGWNRARRAVGPRPAFRGSVWALSQDTQSVEALETELVTARTERDQAKEELRELKTELKEAKAELREMKTEGKAKLLLAKAQLLKGIDELKATNADLEEKLEDALKENERLAAQLNEAARGRGADGRHSFYKHSSSLEVPVTAVEAGSMGGLLRLRGTRGADGKMVGLESIVATSIPIEGVKISFMTVAADPRGSRSVHVAVLHKDISKESGKEANFLRLFSIAGRTVKELGCYEGVEFGPVYLSPTLYGHVYVCALALLCYDVVHGIPQPPLKTQRLVPLPSIPGGHLALEVGGWTPSLQIIKPDANSQSRGTFRGGQVLEVDSSGHYCLVGGYCCRESEGSVEREVQLYAMEGENFEWEFKTLVASYSHISHAQNPVLKFFPSISKAPSKVHFLSTYEAGVVLYEFGEEGLKQLRKIQLEGVSFSKPFAFSLPSAYSPASPAWLLSADGCTIRVRNVLGECPNSTEALHFHPEDITKLQVDSLSSAVAVCYGKTKMAVWSAEEN